MARALTTVRTHPLGATAADLAVAAEAIQRLAFAKDLRPQLNEVAASALDEAAEGSDSSDDGVRLQQAARGALATLRGDLDVKERARAMSFDDASKLDMMPHYNVFISHKRTDAQDFARGLHSLLVGQGFTSFLDVDALEEISDLPLIVSGCDALVVVLTDHVLESRWVRQHCFEWVPCLPAESF